MGRFSVVVLSVLLMLTLAGTSGALAAPPDGKGHRASESKDTGSPKDPNCWGTTTSHMATTHGGMGGHASDPDMDGVKGEQRQGVGNVARNDRASGTRPSDHAALVGPQMGAPPCDQQ